MHANASARFARPAFTRFSAALLGLAALLLAIVPDAARAADPAEAARTTVQDFYAVLVQTMKDGPGLGHAGRAKMLEPALVRAYDLPTMTRNAVGPSWSGFDEATRQTLVAAFTRYTVATYANRFTSFDGETFEVGATKPSTGGRLVVETRLVPAQGEPVQLNYLMAADPEGRQRIVDVFLNGTISQIATTRSEFTATLRKDGAPGLEALLDRRVAELARG